MDLPLHRASASCVQLSAESSTVVDSLPTDRDVFVEGAENNTTDKLSELELRSSTDENARSTGATANCSVSVRTLPTGIYVAKSVSSLTVGGKNDQAQQRPQQQFPLLQNIGCDKKN